MQMNSDAEHSTSPPGLGHDPGGEVHRDPANVVADQLDLAGVQPDPDLQAVLDELSPDAWLVAEP
jgi:hypothetical protein